MGNLLTARTKVTQRLGDNSLVGESGGLPDYATDHADAVGELNGYINAGMRRILDMVPSLAESKLKQISLQQGSYRASVPGLRTVDWVDVVQGEERAFVDEIPLEEMRRTYGEPFSSVTTGTPKKWARNIGTVAPITSINGAFTVEPTFYLSNADVDYNDIYDNPNTWIAFPSPTMAYDASGDSIAYSQTFTDDGSEYPPLLIHYLGKTYTEQATLTVDANISAGDVFLAVGLLSGSSFTLQSWGGLSQSGSVAVEVTEPWNIVSIVCRESNRTDPFVGANTAGSAIGVINTVSVVTGAGNVIFMPPSDTERTMNIYGSFLEEEITTNTDSNKLLRDYEEGVVLAAMLEYHVARGNNRLVQHFSDQLNLWMLQRVNDNADYAYDESENCDGQIMMTDL